MTNAVSIIRSSKFQFHDSLFPLLGFLPDAAGSLLMTQMETTESSAFHMRGLGCGFFTSHTHWAARLIFRLVTRLVPKKKGNRIWDELRLLVRLWGFTLNDFGLIFGRVAYFKIYSERSVFMLLRRHGAVFNMIQLLFCRNMQFNKWLWLPSTFISELVGFSSAYEK